MRITTFGHSCLLVEDGDARLLIDPGGFSAGFEDLRGLTGILVTHQHADHLDRARLPGLLAGNPGVPLYTDPQTAALLQQDGIDVRAVRQGDLLEGVGTQVSVHGDNHAVVHRDIPVVDNVGYLVGGRLFHPGDALHDPGVAVEILALPASAPWMAVKEAIDYQRQITPVHAFPIHAAVVSEQGLALHLRLLEMLGPQHTTLHVPAAGASMEF